MSSTGSARLAETCRMPDESPSVNVGRGKQVDAIRKDGNDS